MTTISKLREAVILSFEEWNETLERDMATAELPEKTPEQMKAEADAILEKAHRLMNEGNN